MGWKSSFQDCKVFFFWFGLTQTHWAAEDLKLQHVAHHCCCCITVSWSSPVLAAFLLLPLDFTFSSDVKLILPINPTFLNLIKSKLNCITCPPQISGYMLINYNYVSLLYCISTHLFYFNRTIDFVATCVSEAESRCLHPYDPLHATSCHLLVVDITSGRAARRQTTL